MTAWDPDWVIRPGVILADELIEREMSVEIAAHMTGLTAVELSRILSGEGEITPRVADCLSKLFGTSTVLWLNLEANYREGLAKGKVDASDG